MRLPWLPSHDDGTCECHVSPAALARALARRDALQLARLDGTAAEKWADLTAGALAVIERMRATEERQRFVRGRRRA